MPTGVPRGGDGIDFEFWTLLGQLVHNVVRILVRVVGARELNLEFKVGAHCANHEHRSQRHTAPQSTPATMLAPLALHV